MAAPGLRTDQAERIVAAIMANVPASAVAAVIEAVERYLLEQARAERLH